MRGLIDVNKKIFLVFKPSDEHTEIINNNPDLFIDYPEEFNEAAQGIEINEDNWGFSTGNEIQRTEKLIIYIFRQGLLQHKEGFQPNEH